MVWIHGGEFSIGGTQDASMSGKKLAAAGLIVVSINYRLGPLGFLSSEELKNETGSYGGMNGVRDQIVALGFIRKIIGSFGGDVARVTVFGQSAGGLSVCSLLFSPLARGLFQQAIIQSGPCIGDWGPGQTNTGLKLSQQVMKAHSLHSLHSLCSLCSLHSLHLLHSLCSLHLLYSLHSTGHESAWCHVTR
jgi:carboxylesterase type B